MIFLSNVPLITSWTSPDPLAGGDASLAGGRGATGGGSTTAMGGASVDVIGVDSVGTAAWGGSS